jgi:hypothetical protein
MGNDGAAYAQWHAEGRKANLQEVYDKIGAIQHLLEQERLMTPEFMSVTNKIAVVVEEEIVSIDLDLRRRAER